MIVYSSVYEVVVVVVTVLDILALQVILMTYDHEGHTVNTAVKDNLCLSKDHRDIMSLHGFVGTNTYCSF
jgi:hypothetical protein